MKRPGTLCAHAGLEPIPFPDGIHTHAPPLYQSSAFSYPSHVEAEAAGQSRQFLYSRDQNPTEDLLAAAVARLEGAEAACVFAAGMAAIAAALTSYAAPGGHLVTTEGLYGVTHTFVTERLALLGMRHTLVAAAGAEEVAAALLPETRVVYLESITNPLLRVADLDGIAALCRRRGIPLIVDATFATPLLQRPIERGATLSIHSATKYLGGHGDLILGVAAGAKADVERLREWRKVHGGNADPFAAWLALRGLRTLSLRVARQVASAQAIAEALLGLPGVERVHYPTLPSHPDVAVARRVLAAGGGMVSFEVAGGLGRARQVYDRLRLIGRAASLGDLASLMTHPATFSHVRLSQAERARFGIGDGLLRLSVGIEEVADLIDDLAAALA